MKAFKIISISSLLPLLFITGCGGDSDVGIGGDTPVSVGGQWSGALTRIQDNCVGSNSVQTLNFNHTVNQNEEAVTLLDGNGINFLGNIVGDDGFSVDATGAGIIPALPCSGTKENRVSYNDINTDSDDTATVEVTVTCPSGASCLVQYSGTASRASNATPTPTSSASPTSTPIVSGSGGCFSINPNPAAGSYSGDGGCGISDAVFRVDGSNVILEPFGVNGASSFAISDSNSSSAASTNTNLSISGISGYSCSMACSPPATFTVSCFKEGGITCSEKF